MKKQLACDTPYFQKLINTTHHERPLIIFLDELLKDEFTDFNIAKELEDLPLGW